ncbi:FtsX-like permease family protein [Cellulomonas fengjieae]|uniref:FtsX-like permease family protein n=1 Tax=Cellulomonas fengjieae TaxID=2819978 RepID=A0ABS3SDI3_9CELL|nr:ABC transporter permease [Cellulomonas fengjieae]MBO3083816.1 FtsX-like permease family protein [Cellulomonas fengjieae]QVI64896.1 FtsX-like permease family protein [Cellulomonas fengjieae]
MLRLTLAQMRRSVGRLTAAAVAIAIGTAFLATTLLAGNVITRTGYDAVTATYADADVVLTGEITDATLDDVRVLPGVDSVAVLAPTGIEIRKGGASRWQMMLPTSDNPRLSSLEVLDGTEPSSAGEIALPATTAKALDVGVGDTVQVRWMSDEPADDATADADGAVTTEETWRTVDDAVVVTGIATDPADAWAATGGAGLMTAQDALRWTGADSLADLSTAGLVTAQPGTSAETLRDAVAAAAPGADVLTRDEAAAEAVAEFSAGGNLLVTVVLGFAAVALLVAALVIANTFQVLVAQRTRTLALLRCVGAGKGQLRRSVLTEAGILGLIASVVGLAAGMALAQAALLVLGRLDLGVPLPSTIQVTVPVVLLPLLVGILVTVLASLVPAREATRVSPMAALRPVDAPVVSRRGGKVRLAAALVLMVGGVAMLLLSAVLARSGGADPMLLLGAGVLAGALSFVGVLLGAVFWVPKVVSLAGRALSGTGTSARLAAANTVRNPSRTAATSTALLIGVTLVAMMSTGAASARVSLAQELDERYPVDLMVDASVQGDDAALAEGLATEVADVSGVRTVLEMRVASVLIGDEWVTVAAPAAGATTDVLRDPRVVSGLADDTLVLPKRVGQQITVDSATLTAYAEGGDGSTPAPGGSAATLEMVRSDLGGGFALVTPSTFEALAPQAQVVMLWVGLAPGADEAEVLQDVRAALPDTPAEVSSAAAQRAGNERLIDTFLAIVVGLLAVAVVIALIGVANTLSLSVLERRRESATLRAIGLSRRQLRWMLAVEGMLIAGVGALLGAVLGLLYGWAGAAIVFGEVSGVVLVVPWTDLLLVLLVALVAGLLASVLPGRAAARTSPVAALAVD